MALSLFVLVLEQDLPRKSRQPRDHARQGCIVHLYVVLLARLATEVEDHRSTLGVRVAFPQCRKPE